MAAKLLKFYDEAKVLGGIKAQMRLAVITHLPSTKAQIEPDTPEYIKKFELAIAEIKKEYK